MLSVLRGVSLAGTSCLGVPRRSTLPVVRHIMGRGSRNRGPALPINVSSGSSMSLGKPVLFTGAVVGTCYVGASIWQYEDMRARMIARGSLLTAPFHSSTYKVGVLRQHINVWWNSLTEGQKIFIPILACNLAVFVAWRIPRLQTFMLNYFSADPSHRAVCWPMFLSTFSHHSPLHLAANMFVLHSFASGAVATLGKEQFLGLYLASGVVASLASHTYKVLMRMPGRSLGASGAIMAVLGYMCTTHPDLRLQIILIPQLNFTAENAIKALVVFDSLGVLLRWRFFDHAAHLGGVFCGIAWALWGQHIWVRRQPLVTWWHDMRGPVTKT